MSKKERTCLVITSYCNTDEKKETLLNTINIVKENLDLDILLHSNRVRLDNQYQNVNYYIFDSRILMLDRSFYRWIKTHGHKLSTLFVDFSFSVIEQVKTITNHLLCLGYEHVIFVNYDIEFNQLDFDDINKFIGNNYNYNGLLYKRQEQSDELNPILMMFDIRRFCNYFNIDKRFFIKKNGYEKYLYDIFGNRSDIEVINRNIMSTMECSSSDVFEFNGFNLFPFGKDKLSLFLFNLKDDINMSLFYNGFKLNFNIPLQELDKHVDGYYKIINTGIDINNGSEVDVIIGDNKKIINVNIFDNKLEKYE